LKIALLFLLLLLSLNAADKMDETKLKNMIARMLIVGFDDAKIDANSQIVKDMQKYELGGVILFDRFYNEREKTKNIASPQQLKQLTTDLQKYAQKPLFISIDQEGGKVARLKPKYGFKIIPSAQALSLMSLSDARKVYETQAQMISEMGINMNFAPVVDLAVNPKNKVIVGLERSYGKNSESVAEYASILIDEQNKQKIVSVLKHFPGHGSSLGDSHQGFVDVSETWNPVELSPYKRLIAESKVEMIMSAHVFNEKLDKKYPATLSHYVNTELLREGLGFSGVLVSDDMQMKAISKHYSLKQSVRLAINSGVDILLFGNQLANVSVDTLVDSIYKEVKNGNISEEKILRANQRIQKLHQKMDSLEKIKIVQKPIQFTKKRRDLTKMYIKTHYGLEVENIKIKPKMIVLHWTAVMDFDKCFNRLDAEILLSDRPEIASASSLNVSAHFLVDRDGTIYQLMADNEMARHVIGLNFNTIGVENVGGEGNKKEDLTPAQLSANIKLVKYLRAKYPSIKHLIGHYEYREYESSDLWLELDEGYRTKKRDPGEKFMRDVRNAVDK